MRGQPEVSRKEYRANWMREFYKEHKRDIQAARRLRAVQPEIREMRLALYEYRSRRRKDGLMRSDDELSQTKAN